MRTLTTLFAALIAGFIFTNTTCAKKIKLQKDVDGADLYFNLLPHLAGTFDYNESAVFNIDSLVKQFDITTSNIANIKPQSATITILDSTTTPITFDIMDNASLTVATATIAEKRVAYKDPMPHNGFTVLNPDVDATTDVLAYAQAQNISYHFKGLLNTALTHAVRIKISVKWHIEATL